MSSVGTPSLAQQQATRLSWLPWLLAATCLLAFGVVAWQSPGFDDEVTSNISLIEHLGTWATVQLMQQEDVHPPGGYLLNGLLFDALGNWSAVRVASALAYATALLLWMRQALRQQGPVACMLVFVGAGLSPTALMWCTSVRWYAYFTPLWMWALLVPEGRQGRWHAVKPALAWWLMAHISYAAIVLAPVLIWWHALHWPGGWRRAVRPFAGPWLVAALAFLPQAWVFITVHAHHTEGQTSGLKNALMGVGISMAGNQGLFPLSPWAIASALGWAGLLALSLRKAQAGGRHVPRGLWATGLATLLMVLSGLAGKYRNLVLMQAPQTLWLSQLAGAIQRTRWAQLCVALIAGAQLVGMANVARHEDTTKNSWNLPVDEVVAQVKLATADCQQAPVVYTYDTVLARALKASLQRGFVADYYQRFDRQPAPTGDCVVLLQTYRGALTADSHAALQAAVAQLGGQAAPPVHLGQDAHARLKQKLDPAFPEHPVSLLLFRQATRQGPLQDWARSRH
jgi:hypothetical protein